MQKNATEIFRHLRPHWFCESKVELIPHKHGGISFLCHLEGDVCCNFWIYICPSDVIFSSKQAVKTLREVAGRDVVTWGTFTLTKEPLLGQLIECVRKDTKMHSVVSSQIVEILHDNQIAERQKSEHLNKYGETLKHYHHI